MKTWKCDDCDGTLTELGSYVKETASRYVHLACFYQRAKEQVRTAIRLEEEAAKQEAENLREVVQRAAFGILPRCPRCGTRVTPTGAGAFPSIWGEVRLCSSGTGNVCGPCVRLEIDARRTATVQPQVSLSGAPTPASLMASAAPKAKEPEALAPDRFSLLDLD